MFRTSLTLCAGLLLATLTSAQCNVTRPSNPPFVPPAGYTFKTPNPAFFQYGSDALWTDLVVDGKWLAFGKEGDGWVFENKLVFWHRGFDWRKDEPTLTVTGRRLDGDAPTVTADRANAVFLPSRDAAGMMTLIKVPTLGCWEITANYEGNDLRYVVSVEPEPRMTAEELGLYGDFFDSLLRTREELSQASLSERTVPLVLTDGDKDECSLEIGFWVSWAANQSAQVFSASIIKGHPLVDPRKVGPTDLRDGVLRLSEIGFDDAHQFAVFTWELERSGMSGAIFREGGTVVFRKTDGKWAQSDRACNGWIT